MDLNKLIETSELLSVLSEEQAKSVVALASPRKYAANDVIFRLGEEADDLLIVCSGRIDLTFPLQVMGQLLDIKFQTIGSGQVLAWSALVPPHHLTMAARAATEVELLAFERSMLKRLFAADQRLGLIVMSNLASVIGMRLCVTQALWVREVQRNVRNVGG